MPTLSGDLSGIFSTGAAAAAEDGTPMAAYFCTIVEACLNLWTSQPWILKEPVEYTRCLFLITRCLGGYPITIYSQFCTRAVQDVLSSNLHLVRSALADKILSPHIKRVVTLDPGKKDFLSLIKDPQSLPLNLPVQPENYLRREIKRGLSNFIVNREVKNLFALDVTAAQDKLVEDLSKIEPCNPRLLTKMLSNVDLQERWLGKFASTRSIQQAAFKHWSSELSVYLAIKSLEERFVTFLRRKCSTSLEELANCSCVTVYTQELRERYWGMRMEGITMPPQQEQTSLCPWSSLSQHQVNRTILITEQPAKGDHKLTARGQYTPYFGSMTRLRALRATLQVVKVGSVVSSIKQLMELWSWVRLD